MEVIEVDLNKIREKIKPSSCGMKRTYSKIDISADKWLLVNDPVSLAKLENPPSLADGLSRETEKVYFLNFNESKLYFNGKI